MRGWLAVLVLCFVAGSRLLAQISSSPASEEGRILSLESAWNQAEQQKDIKALDLLLSENLVYTDHEGSFMDKAHFLASVSERSLHPEQIANVSVQVHMYGKTAVVTGIYRETGTQNGKNYTRRGRFTDTWINVNNTWQCIASQSTLIAP